MTHRRDPKDPPARGHGAAPPSGNGHDGFAVHDRRFWVTGEGDGDEEEPAVAFATPPTQVAQLEAELAKARAEVEEKDRHLQEYRSSFQEQVARGVEETKERLQRNAQKELQLARGDLVRGFLEVLDNLQRSIRAADGTRSVESLLEGLRLVERQLEGQLAVLGLERITAQGQPFDPARHDAVTVMPVDDPAADQTVVAEFQAGYTFADRVLRPARVAVGRLRS